MTGGDRHNPDRSLYPGDAMHYFFTYRGSDTCLSFKVKEVKSHGSITLTDHNVAKAINITGLEPGEPWPELNVRDHSHGAYNVKVEWVDDDDDELPYAEWNVVSASHGRHGEPLYEDEESVDAFYEYAKNRCTSDRVYAGCAWGHAEVSMNAVNKVCLHETMRSEGIPIPEGLRDECKDRNYVTMSVEGKGKRCSKNAEGGWECETFTRTRTATARMTILEPHLELELTKPPLYDAYGFEAQNLDGTYYIDDPIHVVHHPVFKWKDDRGGAIVFEAYRHWCPDDGECTLSEIKRQLPTAKAFDCEDDTCDNVFSVPDHTDTLWRLGNGDGQTAYIASDPKWFGTHGIKYRIEAYNIEKVEDRMLNFTHNDTSAKVVGFDPVLNATTYTVLADDGQYSSDNRFAMAVRYFGSWGGENGDANMTEPYEYRRARIDSAYGGLFGYNQYDGGNATSLLRNLVWSEGPRTPAHVLDYGAQDYPRIAFHSTSSPVRPDIVPASDNGAAMWPKAGYGRIFFTFGNVTDYNFGSTYAAYFNVTGHVYTFVTDFAGYKILPMEAEPYTYPDAAFHHAITLKSIDSEGNIRPAPLMIKSVVREDLGAIPLSDYIHEKILYDTDDIGFADLAVHDTYPMELDIETDSGLIDTKIRRTASWFPKFTHDAHVGPEGPGAPLKLDPSDLVVPIVDGLNSFSEFGKVQSDSEIVSGIVGFFGFITQTTTFGDVFDENMTDVGSIANRTDLSELMKLVNATQELGYGGPEEVSIASYYAYPDTSRLNMPLNTGFEIGSSPVNVTYGNGFYSHFMNHVKPVFEGHTTLLINSALDNVLNVTRHGDVAMIWPTENFGPVLAIELNSTSFPIQTGFEGQCITGCAVPVGWGDVDIKAHNQWGGQANYHSPAQEKPPPREEEPVDYDMWFLLAGIVAMVALIGRLVKNRLERGVWSINA